MAILIKNIKMPIEDMLMILSPDGAVTIMDHGPAVAVEIPEPHGRLIDADALIAAHKDVCSRSMKFNLDLAPTVIPASDEAE